MRGYSYQARVTAYVATVMLAEESADPPFFLRAPVATISCETTDAVDDLVVSSGESRAFVQAKRRIENRLTPVAPMAKALNQFIAQFNTDFDPESDLLVLTFAEASAPIQQDLGSILSRASSHPVDGSLSELVRTEGERTVLINIQAFVRANWPEDDLSESDALAFLRSIRLQQLQLEDGQSDAARALDLLRDPILVDSSHADAAWAQLVLEASDLIATRGSATRHTFRHALGDATIQISAARSYRDDIRRLRDHSQGVIERLGRSAHLTLGDRAIMLDRPYSDALTDAVADGNVLVVGEPGAGKSGTLHGLATMAAARGCDVVAFSALELAAQSLGELRTELGLQHQVLDVLREWPGVSNGLLIVDALDAARGSPSIGTLTSLVERVGRTASRWRVVASIREFDLRMNRRVRGAFPGESPPGPSSPLPDMAAEHVRHVVVGPLTDGELSQLESLAPTLHELLDGAPPKLFDVLRNPFNLDLAAELVSRDLFPEDLGSIRSQRELLDRFWEARLYEAEEIALGVEMEKGLRLILEAMVSARQLQADRGEVIASVSGTTYERLRSTELIVESAESGATGGSVNLKHHVLFDYAACRLLLPEEPQKLAHWLGVNRDLVLLLRPSLQLRFDALWSLSADHSAFWETAFALISEPRIPEIGRLIAPAHAASHATSLNCFRPLMDALEGEAANAREVAGHAFKLMAGAIICEVGERESAGPWPALLRWMASRLTGETVFAFRGLLYSEIERSADSGNKGSSDLGESARGLLRFAWAHQPYNSFLARNGLRFTCRTFTSDPTASASLIRQSLEPAHLVSHGAEEMPFVCMEIADLMALDPPLVSEIYLAVFGYRELSEEPTSMGGAILPLRSTRKQDYSGSKYSLVTEFSRFLATDGRLATTTLLRLLEPYLQDNRHLDIEAEPAVFAFLDQDAQLLGDMSSLWDQGSAYRHDDVVQLLDHFEGFLERLASDNDQASLKAVLEVLSKESRVAVVWRRLLELGSKFPTSLGVVIKDLGAATPILSDYDTRDAAAAFIWTVHPLLEPDDRAAIERAVLAVGEQERGPRVSDPQAVRTRLLAGLSLQELVTEEARETWQQDADESDLTPEVPRIRTSSWAGTVSEAEYLAEQGVPVDDPANVRIRELEQPVQEFQTLHNNERPSRESVEEILPALQDLRAALQDESQDGAHVLQRHRALGVLVAGAERATLMEGLDCDTLQGEFCYSVLMEASTHPEPEPREGELESFDRFQSWGGYQPRIYAAGGLVVLARSESCVTPELFEEIERLAGDPVPAVRYQVATRLNALADTNRELMWKLAASFASDDPSMGVLRALLGTPMSVLIRLDLERAFQLLVTIRNRLGEGPGSDKIRNACASILGSLYVWKGHTKSREAIEEIVADPARFSAEAADIAVKRREDILWGDVGASDVENRVVRQRAIGLLEELVHSGWRSLIALGEASSAESADEDDPRVEIMRTLAAMLDSAAFALYSGSGALGSRGNRDAPDPAVSQRLYFEADNLLDALTEIQLASVTHHLVEALEAFVPHDPRGVFLRTARAISSGRGSGYEFETMAEGTVVGMIERYLAEFPGLLATDYECREALIGVLDVFVTSGSQRAVRLSYELGTIFR